MGPYIVLCVLFLNWDMFALRGDVYYPTPQDKSSYTTLQEGTEILTSVVCLSTFSSVVNHPFIHSSSVVNHPFIHL